MSEDKKEQKNKFTPQSFQAEYEQLCLRYGFTHMAFPVFAQERDGSFSIVVNMQIVKLPTV